MRRLVWGCLAWALLAGSGAAAPPAVRGVALAPHFEGERELAQMTARIDEIAALGATWVQLVVQWGQREVRSVTIVPYQWGTQDSEVRALARYARSKGLRVFIFPVLRLAEIRPGKWRGNLAPVDLDAWWRGYTRFILHYARLAAEEGASLLSVGSELGAMEHDVERWQGLIQAVRAVFPGQLTYSANWDHFYKVTFWSALDVVGLNGYFPLTQGEDPTEAELLATWTFVRDRVLAWRPPGKPLMLTEVGYPSVRGAARRPYHYAGDGPVDLEVQRRAFVALREAWSDKAGLDGVFIWAWTGPGGPTDRGYTLNGKPAYPVVQGWFTDR